MKTFSNFLKSAINLIVLSVFLFGQFQPAAAMQTSPSSVTTARAAQPESSSSDTNTGVALPEKTPVEKAYTPAAQSNTPAPVEAKKEAGPSIKLSANPKFVTGNGQVTILWEIDGIKPSAQTLTLEVSLADGYSPDASAPGAYDAAAHTLSLPVSATKGQFLLNVQNPGEDVLFAASLLQNGQILAQTSLRLPVHEKFNVDKRGGSISARKGKVKISFPAGVLPENATLDVGAPSGSDAPDYLSDTVFEINAQGKQSTQELRQFSGDILIEMDYSDFNLAGKNENDLMIYWYNPATRDWAALPSAVDTRSKTLQAVTRHFSVFDVSINDWKSTRLPGMDAFQVSNFTGAATYSLPIEVPPGPGGLQPSLSLNYNSQVIDQSTARTQASWVGMGWSLGTGSMERNDNGTPAVLSDDTFNLNVNGISSMVVRIPDGSYRAADENFMRITNDAATGWKVWDKTGNIYTFATVIQQKYAKDGVGDHCGFDALDQRWMLTSIQNIFGQNLTYTYYNETKLVKFSVYSNREKHCVTGTAFTEIVTATYPETIVYPNGRYRIRFEREPRADYVLSWPDDYSNQNFEKSRLKYLYIEQAPNLAGNFETVVRKYQFDYAANNSGNVIWPGLLWSKGGNTSTLERVSQFGLGGAGAALPATTFTYGDKMHLTRADNGYGGAVEFEYTQWYDSNAPQSQTDTRTFGAPGRGCDTGGNAHDGFFKRPGTLGYVGCVGFKNRGGVLYFRGIAVSKGMINGTAGFERSLIRPGGTYRIEPIVREVDSGITLQYGLCYATCDDDKRIWKDVFDTSQSQYVTLPTNASTADVLLQATSPTIGYASFYQVKVRLLPSFYRVTAKRLFDGQGSAPYSFGYDYGVVGSAATNDDAHSVLASACTDKQLEAASPDCYLYNEKYSEFRGHSTVTETGPEGRRVIITHYYQDDILKGRPIDVTVKDYDKVLSVKKYTYTPTELPVAGLIGPNRRVYNDVKRYWVTTESEENYIYNNNGTYYNNDGSYNAIRTEYTYEPTYGNLTDQFEYSLNGSNWNRYRWTHTYYIYLNPNVVGNPYLTGLPAAQNVFDPNNNNALVAQTLNIYDANSAWNQPPTTGKLAAVRTWVSDTDTLGLSQVSYGYDGWGNRTTVTTYSAYGTRDSAPASGARTTTTLFDSAYNTYPVSETNALNQTTRWDYNYSLGLPKSQTDANNQITSAYYDNFGRLTQLVKPGNGDAKDTAPTFRVTYVDTARPFHIDLRQKIDGNTYTTSNRYYDGLGRQIKTETGGLVNGTYTLNNTVTAGYDAYGHVIKQSTPFGAGLGVAYTTSTYDALGRPTLVTAPDGSGASYDYNGLTTTLTQTDGQAATIDDHITTTISDVWGRTRKVTPPTGPFVEYTYDLLNQLTDATRAGLNTHITYDKAGRKTGMSDPDMGIWSYKYDAIGSLTQQTDARGCLLSMSYDPLNRLTTKDSSGNCGTQVNSVYTYDSGTNGKGRRTSMSNNSGSTNWSYDARGRVTSEAKTIDGQTFITGSTYNSADLPVTMTYPGDGEIVTNTYTPQMMLKTVAGTNPYVTDTIYDSAGRIKNRVLGNTLTQNWNYFTWDGKNPNIPGDPIHAGSGGKLQSLTTGTIQNLAYAYDPVGNIKQITNNIAGETSDYGYDPLDRLTSWTLNGGKENYAYNAASGNLETKAGMTLYYDDVNHKHAVSSTSGGGY